MPRVETVTKEFTTDASGDAEVEFGVVNGFVEQVKIDPGDMLTGADIVLVGKDTNVPILSADNIGTSPVWWYPRVPANAASGGAAVTTQQQKIPLDDEGFKLTVSQGGDTKTGSISIVCTTPTPY